MPHKSDVQVALISGGTSGIGFATAKLLLKEGWCVVINGRNEKVGQKAKTKLRRYSSKVQYIQGWDLLVFVHSFFREDNLPICYLYAMMNGYSSACTARETVLHIKDILGKHEYLFKFCRMLNPLHFVDTEAAVKAYDFMLALKTE